MKKLRKIILLLSVPLLAVLAGGYYSTPAIPRDGVFVVAEGESTDSVIERLYGEGFIRSRTIFRWDLRNSGLATKIQPGEHALGGAVTYGGIIERLASGGVAEREVTLLVREGENLRDIKATLEAAGLPAADGFFDVTGSPAVYPTDASVSVAAFRDKYPFLADVPSGASLEGFLFPDTYRVFSDATAEDIVVKMLDNFGRKLTPDLRSAIDESGRSLFETITMASILEREVRGDDDRRLVADIFWRRLDSNTMRLQSCATVNYVIGGKRSVLSYEDTQIASPYNTYRNDGLPPGPIGNPGLSALKAAADPAPNDYWFFLTDDEGNVHYARTLDEHNRNKATYLK